jgi:NADPH-dependent ferric siderophore reductase
MDRIDVTRLQRRLRLSFGSVGGGAPIGGAEDSGSGSGDGGARHEISRVRHEIRRRTLTVTRIELLTPRMRRIHFASPELTDFRSLSADDHIKLFFPAEGGGEKPVMRDYTPRAFNSAEATLTLDFALHDAGPATQWATQAQVGDTLEIGGPRGSHVVPDDFDWYLFVGDETALPAIGRWTESLRSGVPVTTVVAIADQREVQQIETRADWRPVWVMRGDQSERDGSLMIDALKDFRPPPGDGFVWIAGEASIARGVRTHMLEHHRHPRAWLKASGYWRRGTSEGRVELEPDD